VNDLKKKCLSLKDENNSLKQMNSDLEDDCEFSIYSSLTIGACTKPIKAHDTSKNESLSKPKSTNSARRETMLLESWSYTRS
jgi:hypothetical protein